MNGEEGINVGDFNPSFLEDGYGVSGLSPMEAPFVQDTTDYVIDPTLEAPEVVDTSDSVQDDNQPIGNACLAEAGDPPGSGTYVLGSVNGTCQWIDTTTCS